MRHLSSISSICPRVSEYLYFTRKPVDFPLKYMIYNYHRWKARSQFDLNQPATRTIAKQHRTEDTMAILMLPEERGSGR